MTQHLVDALEGISFQRSSTFLADLSVQVAALQGTSDVPTYLKILKEIGAITFRNTGMSVKFHMVKDRDPNAFVYTQDSNTATPMRPELVKQRLSRSSIQSEKEFFKGVVDLSTGRVSGIYSEIEINIFLSTGFLDKTPRGNYFLPEEIAAVLMHEIGHALFYFRYLGCITISNLVVAEITRRILGGEDQTLIQEVVRIAEVKTGYKLKDLKTINNNTNPLLVQQIVLAQTIEQIRSDLGSNYYDARAFEFSADQFVARHGGGMWIARGLDRIYREFGINSMEYNTKKVQFGCFMLDLADHSKTIFGIALAGVAVGSSLGLGAAVLATGGISIAAVLIGTVVNVLFNICVPETGYDDISNRFQAMRREIVAFTKLDTLTKDQRIELAAQLDYMNTLVGQVKENKFGPGFISSFVAGVINGRTAQLKFQREMEELANNRLFELSNALQTK